MNARMRIAVLIFLLGVFIQACAKAKPAEVIDDGPVGGATVSASNPKAQLSDIMQRLKGRWVRDNPDPLSADPPTMRLYATADNTLEGRFLVTGGYADVGVKATLKQVGATFTLTLTDDELRQHDFIPKERVFTGTFDAETKELVLKSTEGEYIKWELPGGYTAFYSAYLYRCVLVPAPSSTPTPGATRAPTLPTSPTTPTIPAPAPPSGGSGGSGGSGTRGRRMTELVEPTDSAWALTMAVAPAPSPSPTGPVARSNACGVMSTYKEQWSRMSGSD